MMDFLKHLSCIFVLICVTRSDTIEDKYSMNAGYVPEDGQFDHLWLVPDASQLWIRLQSCSHVNISLAIKPYETHNAPYFINIANNVSQIMRFNEIVHQAETPNILSCDKFQTIFIRIKDGTQPGSKVIEVGYGLMPIDDQGFLHYEDRDPQPVNAVGFASSVRSFVEFPRDLAATTFLRTGGLDSFDHGKAWVSSEDRDFMVFGVKSGTQANIALTHGFKLENYTQNAYVIVITDTEVLIKKRISGVTMKREPAAGLLKADEFRYFWVRWENYIIQLGRGETVGEDTIIEWEDLFEDKVNVSAVNFYSDGTQSTYYRINLVYGDEWVLSTQSGHTDYDDDWIEIERHTYFLYYLRACKTAVLRLKTDLTPDTPHDVILTLDDTTSLTYWSPDQSENRTKVINTPGLISCDVYHKMWFSWSEGHFRLGRGHDPNDLMSMVLDEKDEFSNISRYYVALHLGSMTTSDAQSRVQWRFNRNAGIFTSLTTFPQLLNRQAWLSVNEQNDVVFAIRTCSDAVITLATYLGISEVDIYEIAIQNSANNKSYITKDGNGQNLVEATTIGYLKCDQITYFWVSWQQGHISVGQGNVVGLNTFLSYQDDLLSYHDINAVSFTGGQWAAWQVGDLTPVDVYEIVARSREHGKNWLVTDDPGLVFSVAACSRVHIALSASPGIVENLKTYEVSIGEGNDVLTEITLLGSNETVSAKTPNILACNTPKFFWLSWVHGTVRLGHGTSFLKSQILELTPSQHFSVRGISFASDNELSSAMFFVARLATSLVQVNTSKQYDLQQFWAFVAHGSAIEIQVASSCCAHIYLSPYLGVTSSLHYEVIIGGSSNTITQIRDGRSRQLKAESMEEGLLSNGELRWFLISWHKGYIQVFKWEAAGYRVVVEWQDPDPLDIYAASLSTTSDSTGLWRLYHVDDLMYITRMKPTSTYGTVWFGVGGQTYSKTFQFKVQACWDARIGMFYGTSPKNSTYTYEVVLGAANNTKVTFTSAKNSSENYEVSYIDILSCTEPRWFWVSWELGRVTVGRGAAPYTVIFSRQVHGFDPINSFAVNSNSDYHTTFGQWEIPELSVQTAFAETQGSVNYQQFWMTVMHQSGVQFSVKTCGNAYLLLSAMPGIKDTLAYEIAMSSNGTIVIYHEGHIAAMATYKDVLKCDTFVSFWLDWNLGLISLGRNSQTGSSRIIHWQSPNDFKITHISFSTDSVATGQWHFSRSQANAYQLLPSDTYSHNFVIMRRFVEHFNFRVQTCSDVKLGLVDYAAETDAQYYPYEIRIGYQGTSGTEAMRTEIRDGVNGPVLASNITEDIVSCETLNDFWVSWSLQNIIVGKGQAYNDIILAYTIGNSSAPTYAVSMASQHQALFEFYQNDVEVLHASSHGEMQYKRAWVGVAGLHYIVFSVQACEDIALALANLPGVTDVDAYEVHILESTSGLTSIRESVNGPPNVYKAIEKIVECNEYNTFWISWDENTIRFGRGAVIHRHEELQWKPVNIHAITAVGITSKTTTSRAIWEFLREDGLGLAYRLHTHGSRSFRNHVAYLWIVKKIEFRVRSCGSAHVLITTTTADDLGSNSFEIVLGGDENKASYIKRAVGEERLVEEATPSLMQCDKFVNFWLSWENGALQVGTGDLDTVTLLSWSLPSAAELHAMAFDTSNGYSGEWELKQDPDLAFWTYTPFGFGYNSIWIGVLGEKQTKFLVRACREARVLLVSHPDQMIGPLMELVIGAEQNTKTILNYARNQTYTMVAEYDTLDILSCSDFLEFWLQWNSSRIVFGKGNAYGSNVVFAHNSFPLDHINSLGLATEDGANGIWVHGMNDSSLAPSIILDERTYIHTDGTRNFEAVEMTLTQQNLIFSVRACQEAIVALSRVPGQVDTDTWVITFGTAGNTKTTIVEQGTSMPPAEFPSENIIHCVRMTTLWVQWVGATLTFGTGNTTGQNQIGGVSAQDDIHITAMSLATGNDEPGFWNILSTAVHDMTVGTSDQYSYEQAWITSYNKDHIVFQVKSCHDPHILLSDRLEDTSNGYEIALGINRNNQSVIRAEKYGDNQITVSTPNIVSCDEYRTFWIRWADADGVHVGYGAKVGVDTFMSYQDNEGKDIQAISFSTGWSATGSWKISNVGVNDFAVMTLDDGQQHHVWIYENTQYFQFAVRACSSASVFLSATPLAEDINTTISYEVILGAVSNSLVVLRRNPGGQVIQTAERPYLLSCYAERQFWVSWFNGQLEVGTGSITGSHVILSNNDAIVVRTISLASLPESGKAYWEFPKDSGRSSIFFVNDEAASSEIAWLDLTDITELVLKVRACDGIALYLTQNFGIATSNAYEIIIGDTQSQHSHIIRDSTGTVVDTDNTADVLRCTESRWVWVSSTLDSLTVGQGAEPGGSLLLSWTAISNRIPIQALGFRGLHQSAMFEFSDVPNNIYEMRTAAEYTYKTVWLTMNRQYFHFEVKACGNAIIALSEIQGNTTWHTYEIVLGSDFNSKSFIYDVDNDTVVVNAETPAVLDCQQHKQFWISWTNTDSIIVGSGEPFSNPFMEYLHIDNNRHIRAVSFSTSQNSPGDWVFPANTGVSTTFFTPEVYETDWVVRRLAGTYAVVFKVKACNDAHVILFDHLHTEAAYEIVIGGGGNNNTWIRTKRLAEPVARAQTVGILSCEHRREFWVSWFDGIVAVGYGGIPLLAEILSYEDPDPMTVNYMALSTGWFAEGEWELFSIPDNTYLITTVGESLLEDVAVRLISSQQTTYALGVQACSDAVVRLLAGGMGSQVLFQIYIGVDNSATFILDAAGDVLMQQATPNILSCYEYKYFYIKWGDHTVQLFEVDARGRNIIAYTEPEQESLVSQIRGLTVASTVGNTAEWEMLRYEEQSLEYHHKQDTLPAYCCLWLTVQDEFVFLFSVKTCQSAAIALTDIPGDINGRAVEIILGTGEDPQNQIRDGIGGPIVASDNTQPTLDCEYFTGFWIRWFDNYASKVTVGRGSIPGQIAIMSYTNSNPFHITGLSVASRSSFSSQWRFGAVVGNMYHAATTTEYRYDRVVAVPRHQSFVFSVQACNDAHLMLQSKPFHDGPGYEIVLGGYSNSRSEIRDGPQGRFLAYKVTKNLMDCEKPQNFWVSWADGVRVGRGVDVGQSELMSYLDSEVSFDISAVGLSTGWNATGKWSWVFEEEKMVRLSFPQKELFDISYHWVTVTNYLSVILRIRACQEVSILLGSQNITGSDMAAVEIKLGDNENMESAIFKTVGGEQATRVTTPQILNCSEYRTFWIGWSVKTITVGEGAGYQNTIMTWHDDNALHAIYAIALLDSPGGPVDYEFVSVFGNTAMVHTDTEGQYDRMVLTPSSKHLVFRVMTCMDAHIALYDYNDTSKYELVIGLDNKYTVLRKLPNNDIVKQEHTELILDCRSYRYFWLTWSNSTIRLGTGLVPGWFEFFFYVDENPMEVNTLSVASGEFSEGTWEIGQRDGDGIQFMTPVTFDYKKSPSWSVFDKEELVFGVMACQHARVALHTVPGVYTSLTYEIIIGAVGNTYIQIIDVSSGQILASKAMSNLVACTEEKLFWVSWRGMQLSVGQGTQVYQQQLLAYQHNETFSDITTVTVATSEGTSGRWTFNVAELPDTTPATTTPVSSTASSSTVSSSTAGTTSKATTASTSKATVTPATTSPVTIHSTTLLPSSTEKDTQEPSDGGLSGGEVAGIVIGVLAAVAIIAAIAFIIYRKRPSLPKVSIPLFTFHNPSYSSRDDTINLASDT